MPKQADQVAGKQDIDTLKERYQNLNEEKIRAEENLKNAESHLAQLRQQAIEEFGTDDLSSLREKLDQMESENEKKRADYQAKLDHIESNLSSVEQSYEESDAEDSQ